MKKTIEITISAEGKTTIEALGYVGASCEHATAELEAALLDGKGATKHAKPERYRQEQREKAGQR